MATNQDMVGGRRNLEAVDMGDFTPNPGSVFVHGMHFGEEKTKAGIIRVNDDGKEDGIKPRWCQVWRCGEGVTDVVEGDWILMEHGRWTRTINATVNGEPMDIRQIDTNDMLLISDEKPDPENIKLEYLTSTS